jgi:hypothetical protein
MAAEDVIMRPLFDIAPTPRPPEPAAPPVPRERNPMRARVGPGPDGVTCKKCVHLARYHYHDYHYIKCELRGVTNGAGTDHRVSHPACALYCDGSFAGHTFPEDWHKGLGKPLKMTSTNTLRCPHCGLLIGFKDRVTRYGPTDPGRYEDEVNRCPQKGDVS